MQTLMAICAGIALAAACGFRVFVPLLVAAIAVRLGFLQPTAHMVWLGSTPAIVILGVATVAEIAAYYFPWIDNALDTIASPIAVIAGTLVAATAFGDIPPVFKWALALIAGGGAAALVQGTTVATRVLSSATTGGLANPVVSTLEAAGATVLAVLAILLPVFALVLVVLLVYLLFRALRRLRSKHPALSVVPT